MRSFFLVDVFLDLHEDVRLDVVKILDGLFKQFPMVHFLIYIYLY